MVEFRTISRGKLTRYYCKIDNKLLAEVYDYGAGIPHMPCKHFIVKELTQQEFEQIKDDNIIKFFNGSTFYLYIPKSE